MSLVYRGTSSDDVKFNVTERRVYNAPAFDVTGIEVPGRSGDILNSQERFKNKAIVYTGFIRSSDFPGDTTWERLSRGLRTIKAWICGDAGKYHDLTDDYDPGFVRRAFVSGETAISEVLDRPDGATITITFMAEPFMYEESDPIELPETDTASGAIASFEGVAAPLQSLKFYIEPSQDLHGYSYPWPAGGGKNLLDPAIISQGTYENPSATANVHTDFVSVKPNTDYTISLTTQEQMGGIYVRKYKADKTTYTNSQIYNNYKLTVTTDADTAFVLISFYRNSGLTVQQILDAKPQLEEGSSATAYAPYSNICPITGWTQCDAGINAENFFDKAAITTGKYLDTVTGLPVNAVGYVVSDYMKVAAGRTVYIPPTNTARRWFYDNSKNPVTYLNTSTGQAFMPPTDGYIRVSIKADIDLDAFQVTFGTAASPYHSYSGTPITIALGQTVYGGTVDALNGDSESRLATVTIDGTQALSYNGTYAGKSTEWYYAPGNKANGTENFISDRFKTSASSTDFGTAAGRAANGNIFFHLPESIGNDGTAARQWFANNPTQVVYELASPTTLSLTPVSVSSLLGQNNIWASCGDTEVEYVEPTENPTEWPSKPRLEITMSGAGTLTVNGKTWSIGAYTGTLICDSEIMDWYDASNLKNSLVSGDGFPELQPGENVITYTGGITKVVAKPRWRTL